MNIFFGILNFLIFLVALVLVIYKISEMYKKGKIGKKKVVFYCLILGLLFLIVAGLFNYNKVSFFLSRKELTDKQAGFSVYFPAAYQKSLRTIEAIDGNNLQAAFYTQDFPNIHNYLLVIEYPEGALLKNSPLQIMVYHANQLDPEMEMSGQKVYHGYQNGICGIEYRLAAKSEILGYCFRNKNEFYLFYTRFDNYSSNKSDRTHSLDFLWSFRILDGPNWKRPGSDDLDFEILYRGAGEDDPEKIAELNKTYF